MGLPLTALILDAARWRPVGDPVMGGRSVGGIAAGDGGTIVFSGVVSPERGGGFASARADVPPVDLSTSRGLLLRVRGDGRRYKLSLRTEPGFDVVVWQTSFEAPPGSWRDVTLPFDSFRPTLRGREVPGAGPLDRSRIHAFGLVVADRQFGPFRLEIASLEAGT